MYNNNMVVMQKLSLTFGLMEISNEPLELFI